MLRKSQLIASFNGIPDIILIMDVEYNIIFANRAFYEFYNIKDMDEITGRKCYKTIHNKLKPCGECPTEQTLQSGCVETVEKRLRGEILIYWTYPVFNGKNNIEYIVSYARIITDQKRIEQELIHSEKLKGIGQLAAGVAHELNNPLCALLGFSEILKESIEQENPLRELINDIIESVHQSKKLVEGLLEYARQSVTNIDCYSIRDVVTQAVALVKYKLKMNEITIDAKYEKDLPAVKIDRQKTVQAFMNIILNAIDASPEKETILIRTQRHGKDYISVTFCDNGCGIPQENISKIFDPFFTTKEVGTGTGLGLSITHSIIEQQSGKIRVESELGNGSTFEILLPVEND